MQHYVEGGVYLGGTEKVIKWWFVDEDCVRIHSKKGLKVQGKHQIWAKTRALIKWEKSYV